MADNSKKDLEMKIRFRIPQKMPSVVATEMIVQPSVDGVLMSFFEIIPPIIAPNISSEDLEAMKEAGIAAECVSKVFIPNSKYATFVQTMASILEPVKEETKKAKKK